MAGAAILVLTQLPDRESAHSAGALAGRIAARRLRQRRRTGRITLSLARQNRNCARKSRWSIKTRRRSLFRVERRSARAIPTNFRRSSLSRSIDGLRPISMDYGRDSRNVNQFPQGGRSCCGRAFASFLRARRSLLGALPAACPRELSRRLPTCSRTSARSLSAPAGSTREPSRFASTSAAATTSIATSCAFAVDPGVASIGGAIAAWRDQGRPFFGTTETIGAMLPSACRSTGASPGATVTVTAESQGCADIGVCYPPLRQKVALLLPLTASAPGPSVVAAPATRGWFR